MIFCNNYNCKFNYKGACYYSINEARVFLSMDGRCSLCKYSSSIWLDDDQCTDKMRNFKLIILEVELRAKGYSDERIEEIKHEIRKNKCTKSNR